MLSTRPLTLVLTVVNMVILVVGVTQHRAASAQGDASILRGRGLELVDAAGQVRAQFTVEANGEAVFRMRDSKGTIRVKLGAGEDGSALLLLDETTEPGVYLLAKRAQTDAASRTTSITLTGADGKSRVITPQN